MNEDNDRKSWTTVGVVLRVHPDVVEDVIGRLNEMRGVYVVFSKTSTVRIMLKEVPYP